MVILILAIVIGILALISLVPQVPDRPALAVGLLLAAVALAVIGKG